MILMTKKLKSDLYSTKIALDGGVVIMMQGEDREKTRQDALSMMMVKLKKKAHPRSGGVS